MTPKAREHRFRRIKELGCICCIVHRYCEIHHLNLGGKAGQKRLGDEFTVGLCPWHHQGKPPTGMGQKEARAIFGPSLKLSSRAFRELYGPDSALLARQNRLIEIADRVASNAA